MNRSVYSVSTLEEIKRHGPPLPMKVVVGRKPDKYKARACVCDNSQRKDPSHTLWTAQAEPASVSVGLRRSLLRDWVVGSLVVSGAFKYAPLGQVVPVVVQPPKIFVEVGLASADERWTLHPAVYGLRVAPQKWALERDSVLKGASWKDEAGATDHVEQCVSDTQVWNISKGQDTKQHVLGLTITYVDDLLLPTSPGAMRENLKTELSNHWQFGQEALLIPSQELAFLGMELNMVGTGITITQKGFIKHILLKYGLQDANPLTTVTMDIRGEEEVPTSEVLKQLQCHAGEFSWLATRTRGDLSCPTSVLTRYLTKKASWCQQISNNVLRYLKGTSGVGLFLARAGDEHQLVAWSDAGFAGASTRAQTGCFAGWAGAPLLWRSSRQTIRALNTAEAELNAAALTWQVTAGIRELFEEFQIHLDATKLSLDNAAALSIINKGATWISICFSVRARRIQEELQCRTLEIAASPPRLWWLTV